MAVVVTEHHPQLIAVGFNKGHGGVVAVGRLADIRQRKPLKSTQHDAQSSSVGKYGHRLAVVLPGYPAQSGKIAVQYHPGGLAALHMPVIHLAVELHQLQGPAGLDLAPGQPLPDTHADFPEGGVRVQRQALGHVNGLGRGLGADQVAGVYGVHRDVPEPPGQGPDLAGTAIVGDEALLMAVGNAVKIAFGLGMADEIDPCHGFSFTAR